MNLRNFVKVKKCLLLTLAIPMLMVLCTVMRVSAAEILEGGSFNCDPGTGTVSWKLEENGDLILYGDGRVSDLTFSVINPERVKRIYCESTIRVSDTNLDGLCKGMTNLEYVNLNPMVFQYTVDSAEEMFGNCSKLKAAYINQIRLSYQKKVNGNTVSVIHDIFQGCTSLEKFQLSCNPLIGYVPTYIGYLPQANGYQWTGDETGTKLLEWKENGKVKAYILDGAWSTGYVESFSQKPIEYQILYYYTVYTPKENGGYEWDNVKEEMVNAGNGGHYKGTTYSWDINTNPESFTVEDNELEIVAPQFCPEGFSLVGYTKKVSTEVPDNGVRYVYADFVQNELLGDEEESTEQQDEVKKEDTKENGEEQSPSASIEQEAVVTTFAVPTANQAVTTSNQTVKASYTLKKLKKGKTYYIRVRACKKVNDTSFYSKWVTKKVTIKK